VKVKVELNVVDDVVECVALRAQSPQACGLFLQTIGSHSRQPHAPPHQLGGGVLYIVIVYIYVSQFASIV
jgi:hypothetical protein